jgi:hypothetical protein
MSIVIAIYFLRHKETNEMLYVGQTQNPRQRLSGHYSTRKFESFKGKLEIVPMFWVDEISANEYERKTIDFFTSLGFCRLNCKRYVAYWFRSKKHFKSQ